MVTPTPPIHYYDCKPNKAASAVGIKADVIELCNMRVSFTTGDRCYKVIVLASNQKIIPPGEVEPCGRVSTPA